jgi:hypothetical protein
MILSNTSDRRAPASLGAATAVALSLFSQGALAQGSGGDFAAAAALYEEGRALLAAGRRAEGCAKFAASLTLKPAASTMINIARCHEQEGKVATAWSDYTRALSLNGDTAGEARRKALEEIARTEMRVLEPRLPRLRIVLTNPPPGVQVRSDDKEVPAAALGEALPADPGLHQVRASAPGHREETRSVTLEEGKTAVIEIELQRGADKQDGPSAASWSRPTGIALAAAGVVGLGVGAVTGILSLDKVSDIESRCPEYPHCPPDDKASRDDLSSAKALGNVSTAGFIAGGVLAAAGAALLLFHPGKPTVGGPGPSSSTGDVRVFLGPGRLELQGKF